MQRLLGFDGERSGDHSDEFVLHSKKPLEIKNIFIVILKVCVCLWVCAHEYKCPWRPEVTESSGARVTGGGCELPSVDAGT